MGYELGVLMLNTKFPRVVGDVGNPSSYKFPVVFKTVEAATTKRVVLEGERIPVEFFIEAAKELERIGVKAITTSCGFLVLYQEEIAGHLKVPFYSSSLLLIPLIEKVISGKILVVTANSKKLGVEHLRAAGASDISRIIVRGMEDSPEFRRVILNDGADIDTNKISEEVVKVVSAALNEDGNIRSILLECHNLPPYSSKLSQEFGLPVFDFFSLVNLIHESITKSGFHSHSKLTANLSKWEGGHTTS